MSKVLSIVPTTGAAVPMLSVFAKSLITKATKSAVTAQQRTTAAANAVAIGSGAPVGVHTAVVRAAGTGAYQGVNTVFVRAVLPKRADDEVPLRDAVDVLASVNVDKEIAEVTTSFNRSAQEVVTLAKAAKVNKVLLVLKQQSAHTALNSIFTEVATRVLGDAGLTIETTTTAMAANQLIMFPESAPVVFTNDYPTTEQLEKAFAGITGSAPSLLLTDEGKTIYGGHSSTSVAAAVAAALRDIGFPKEADAVIKAMSSAKYDQHGNDILSAV